MQGYSIEEASAKAERPPSKMELHAKQLNDLAMMLNKQNSRLVTILNRLGVTPKGAAPTETTEKANPVGLIYVAQFGAERLSRDIDNLRDLLSALEEIA